MAKVWCYVLDADGVTGLTSFDGSIVANPLWKHLYECEDDNIDLADDGSGKLYHAANDKIDASDLQVALDAYVPPVLDPNVGLGWFLFDDADELTEVGVDIAAGMNNKDLKAKHGIKAADANKLRKEYEKLP